MKVQSRFRFSLNWLWVAPLGFLLIFFFYPLAVILVTSLKDFSVQTLASLHWANIGRVTRFTFYQAGLSTLLTLVVGIPGAYLFARYKFRGKTMLRVFTNLPFILPTVVAAAGFSSLIGPRGLVNLLLESNFQLDNPPIRIVGTIGAILLAHIFYNISIVLRIVGGAWAGLDPRPGLASRTLGANSFQTFTQVTLPLLTPAILSATLLVFLFDFTSFGVVMLLGNPALATIEMEIYTQAMHMLNLPLAAILTLLQFICTLLMTILYRGISAKPVQLAPVSERINEKFASTFWQKLFVFTMILILGVLVVSPLAALLLRAFIRLEAARGELGQVQMGLTLDYFKALFVNSRQSIFYVPPIFAIWNSLKTAFITAIISLTIGLSAAYASRNSGWLTKLSEISLILPLGASAVTLGLGMLLAFSRPPLLISASPWIIPIAHSITALPFVLRTLSPALKAIPRQLLDSAESLGASPIQTIRLVELPLIRSALVTSLVFGFTISLGEFGATAFLTRPEFPTIPIAIFRFLSQPGGMNYGQAFAMAAILLLICGVGIWAIEQFGNQTFSQF